MAFTTDADTTCGGLLARPPRLLFVALGSSVRSSITPSLSSAAPSLLLYLTLFFLRDTVCLVVLPIPPVSSSISDLPFFLLLVRRSDTFCLLQALTLTDSVVPRDLLAGRPPSPLPSRMWMAPGARRPARRHYLACATVAALQRQAHRPACCRARRRPVPSGLPRPICSQCHRAGRRSCVFGQTRDRQSRPKRSLPFGLLPCVGCSAL